MLYAAELDDLQAVHNEDIHVHYDDIGAERVNFGQGFHPVRRLADDLAVVRRPVEQALEALAYDKLWLPKNKASESDEICLFYRYIKILRLRTAGE